ncbi:DNA repair protein [Acidimangrovimonas sediminis]|uniref:DNA repair protein n=1 Tax=Acidimangrovimonas sediminis TaxID=2056283 RepID=UPI001E2AA3DB|nr:DNA repair protein [Acidimangrovimonas sediminis]
MTISSEVALRRVQSILQTLALGALLALTAAAIAASAMAALGQWPWLQFEARFGDTTFAAAGTWAQIGLTAFLVGLCFFLPANGRMMRLERSHRDFRISIDDVTTAYAAAHAADRDGAFALSSEFESMRARMEHLRHHPDLSHLEPELLQLAAEMSHISRDLARVYSDEKVARAKTFLVQRQQEVDSLREKLKLAQYACDELKRWMADIEADETDAARQIARLESDLRDVLPGLGYDFEDVQHPGLPPADPKDTAPGTPNVVQMQPKTPSK